MRPTDLAPANTKLARENAARSFVKLLEDEEVSWEYLQQCMQREMAPVSLEVVMDKFGMYLAFKEGRKGQLEREIHAKLVRSWDTAGMLLRFNHSFVHVVLKSRELVRPMKSTVATACIIVCVSELKPSSDRREKSVQRYRPLKTRENLWSPDAVINKSAKALYVAVIFHAPRSKIHYTHNPAIFMCCAPPRRKE